MPTDLARRAPSADHCPLSVYQCDSPSPVSSSAIHSPSVSPFRLTPSFFSSSSSPYTTSSPLLAKSTTPSIRYNSLPFPASPAFPLRTIFPPTSISRHQHHPSTPLLPSQPPIPVTLLRNAPPTFPLPQRVSVFSDSYQRRFVI